MLKKNESEKKRKAYKLLLRFAKYFKKFKLLIVIGFICLVINLFLSLVQPIISKLIIDKALINKDMKLLNLLGLLFLSSAILSYLVSSLRKYIFLYIQQKIILKVRQDLTGHILNLPMTFHNYQHPGYLMARVNSDVGNLSGVMTDSYVQTLLDFLMLITASVILFVLSWKLAIITVALLPFFLLSLNYFSRKINLLSGKLQESSACVSASLQEIFSSVFAIRIFGKEKSEIRIFVRNMIRFLRVNMKMIKINLFSNLTMGVIATLAPLFVIWYGGFQVIKGEITIGTLFAFNMYLVYMFTPLRSIYNTIQSISSSVASLERIYQVFDLQPSTLNPPTIGIDRFKDIIGSIEFKNLNFSYMENKSVLNNISFKIKPFQTVALVGPSGAGKTTIFNLLLRLYENYSGQILIDDMEIREMDQRLLRKSIRLVPQEPHLFNRTIYDNIAFGGSRIKKDDVIMAAKISRSTDFIKNLPNGYDTVIGQRGTTLSGGEKQRISLARALLANPKIILLDEATAFLDSKTESLVQEGINDAVKNRTCIIIAHRLSTVLNADLIIVLANGSIVDTGRHNELYSHCQLYHELCEKQFKLSPNKILTNNGI